MSVDNMNGRDDSSTRGGSVAERSRVSSLNEHIHSSYLRASLLRQAEEKKARKVRFYRNGDRFYRGAIYAVSPERFRTFDSLLAELTKSPICDPKLMPNGVRYIFSLDGARKIVSLDDLQEGESYVCATLDLFKEIDYTKSLDPAAWHQSGRGARSGTSVVEPALPGGGVIRRQTPTVGGDGQVLSEEESFVDQIKPRLVTVVRGGPRPRSAVRIPLNKRTARSFEQVLRGISDIIRLDSGSVKRMYTVSGKQVLCLADFFLDDTIFLACGAEKPTADDFHLDSSEVRLVCAYRFSASAHSERVTLRSQSSSRARAAITEGVFASHSTARSLSQPASPLSTRRNQSAKLNILRVQAHAKQDQEYKKSSALFGQENHLSSSHGTLPDWKPSHDQAQSPSRLPSASSSNRSKDKSHVSRAGQSNRLKGSNSTTENGGDLFMDDQTSSINGDDDTRELSDRPLDLSEMGDVYSENGLSDIGSSSPVGDGSETEKERDSKQSSQHFLYEDQAKNSETERALAALDNDGHLAPSDAHLVANGHRLQNGQTKRQQHDDNTAAFEQLPRLANGHRSHSPPLRQQLLLENLANEQIPPGMEMRAEQQVVDDQELPQHAVLANGHRSGINKMRDKEQLDSSYKLPEQDQSTNGHMPLNWERRQELKLADESKLPLADGSEMPPPHEELQSNGSALAVSHKLQQKGEEEGEGQQVAKESESGAKEFAPKSVDADNIMVSQVISPAISLKDDGSMLSGCDGDDSLISDRYHLLKTLGEGGRVTIKECICRDSGQKLAMKIIDKKTCSKLELQSVAQEVSILRQVGHVNLVSLVEGFETPDAWYLAMDLDEGTDVATAIVASATYSEMDAGYFFIDLLQALHHLHLQNIIHGDVSEKNLLVIQEGNADRSTSRLRLKLGSFACATYANDNATVDGSARSGDSSSDDIWHAGCILWTLLTGTHFSLRQNCRDDASEQIFSASAIAELLEAALLQPEWIGVSDAAKDLVVTLLHSDESKRLRSAGEALSHPWLIALQSELYATKDHQRCHGIVAHNLKKNFPIRPPNYSANATALRILMKTSLDAGAEWDALAREVDGQLMSNYGHGGDTSTPAPNIQAGIQHSSILSDASEEGKEDSVNTAPEQNQSSSTSKLDGAQLIDAVAPEAASLCPVVTNEVSPESTLYGTSSSEGPEESASEEQPFAFKSVTVDKREHDYQHSASVIEEEDEYY